MGGGGGEVGESVLCVRAYVSVCVGGGGLRACVRACVRA